MPRSLAIHPAYRPTIPQTLERNGFLTQGDLAANLFIALSTVNNFCRGQKISVAKFEQICDALNLEPREMILPPPDHPQSQPPAQPPEPRQYFAFDDFWVGREALIQTLLQKLENSCRLLLVAGISGIGKTALAEHLVADLQQRTPALFFHRETFDDPAQTNNFASVAARLLESCGQAISPEERSQPQQLARRLIAHLQATPTLILLDSLETILEGDETKGWSTFEDPDFLNFFKAILASDRFASRLILTSQDLPPELVEAASRYRPVWHCQPLSGLTEPEQQVLFTKTGFTLNDMLTRIGKAYEGHPLALRTILGEISDRPFFGNVSAYWKCYGKEIEVVEQAIAEALAGKAIGADDKWQLDRFTRALRYNVQQRLEHTFIRLRQDSRTAYILLCESSVYRCAVPEDWWLSHLEDWEQDEVQQEIALDVLRERYLVEEKIEETELLLQQHTLIRSVSLAHLKQLTFDVTGMI